MIPMARPEMGPEEIEAVRKVMESGMLAHGPEVEMFEEEFARFCGVEHAATVSSGTSAIHLALASLDIGPGDEVITTAFSFIASATPILFLGAVPAGDPHRVAAGDRAGGEVKDTDIMQVHKGIPAGGAGIDDIVGSAVIKCHGGIGIDTVSIAGDA